MERFSLTIAIIIIGLFLGYFIQILNQKKIIHLSISMKNLSKILQKIALLFLNPIALIGALWMAELNSFKLLILPVLGILAWTIGGFVAWRIGKLQRMENHKLGAYIIAGSFSNVGVIGGIICYVFFGEIGFAFVPIYKLFEELTYYGVGFPIAKALSTEEITNVSLIERLKNIFSDTYIRVAMGSILIGLILNFTGIKRPEIYSNINGILIPATTIILLTSIGLNMRFHKIKEYIKPSIILAIFKMLLLPVCIGTLGYLFGLGSISDGLPLKVAIVLSSMPTGFIALVPPSIYNLDIDLANTIWIVTTSSLLIVVPILYFVTSWI